jgi:hypothetical protein
LRPEIGEQRPAPEAESFAHDRRSSERIDDREGPPAFLEQPLEARQVDLVGRHLEHIPRRPSDDDSIRVALLEHPAQARDGRLEGVRRCLGRLTTEELVDQAITRDDLVRV